MIRNRIWLNSAALPLGVRLKKSCYWQKNYSAILVGHEEGAKVRLGESRCEDTGKSLWGQCSGQPEMVGRDKGGGRKDKCKISHL